jgi:hypothetical protein
MYVCICTSLVPEWFDRFYSYLVFKGQCLMNINILPPKIEALQMGAEKRNFNFLKNGYP